MQEQMRLPNEQADVHRKSLQEPVYDDFLLQGVALLYEVDLTANRIVRIRKGSESTENADEASFSEIIAMVAKNYIREDCRELLLRGLDVDRLIHCYESGRYEFNLEFVSNEMTGMDRWYSEKIRLLSNPQNEHIMALLYVRDIHEQKQRELMIEQEAKKDSLTGLYNRGAVQEIVENYVCSADGHRDMAAMLIIDLDNFKMANDTYGHSYGDKVLCMVARLLERFFPKAAVGRFGGDEYIVFLENLSSKDVLNSLMEHLCDELYVLLGDVKCVYRLSASVGAAIYAAHGTTYTELYDHADEAQYQAKRTGKNGCYIYGEYNKTSSAAKFVGPEWLLDEISEAIYVCDALTNEILYVNKAMMEWFDLEREQLRGRTCYEGILHRREPCGNCPRRQIYKSGLYAREKDILIHGEKRHVLLKTKLVQWNGRSAQLEIIMDITQKSNQK